MTSAMQPPNILIVDDTPANLQLLMGMLQNDGYRVRPVTSGEHALRAVRAESPDLILLDISMPDMDGYEVCRQLKASPETASIPVLFISALTDTDDKLRAFEAGGLDYVSKPFQIAEVLARVRTHVRLRAHERALMDSLERQRELERLRDSLTHMVAHDMRSPLLALRLALNLLEDTISQSDRELVLEAKTSVDSLIQMINDMIDISRMESTALSPKREPVDLVGVAQGVLDSTRLLAGGVTVSLETSPSVMADVDVDLFRRVLTNLVCNAYKFAKRSGRVVVGIDELGSVLRVRVTDDGCGIAPQDQARVFDKYGQVEGDKKKYGSGLGLTFCKLAVEAHGGSIGVDSILGQGCTFWFSLPRATAMSASSCPP